MSINIAAIYRHPVKGLTPESLQQVTLTPGEGLPQDRRFAIAHGSTRIDPSAPAWMPKSNFLMLARNERLARLRSQFDDATGILTIQRDGKTVASANITDHAGRTVIEQFFAAYMAEESRGAPRLVEAPGHMFSDTAAKVVSIIGLESVRDVERVVRAPVDPRRFRANIYVGGGRAWQEFDWPGREIRIGGTRLKVTKKIDRCAATNVDPESGQRDLNIPLALQRGFQHIEVGVYAEVLDGGPIAIGDTLTPPA